MATFTSSSTTPPNASISNILNTTTDNYETPPKEAFSNPKLNGTYIRIFKDANPKQVQLHH